MGSAISVRASHHPTLTGLVATCIGVGFFASPTVAQDRFGGSISITNDYRVRGLTQTRNKPAIQGGVHARFDSGWFVGAWASTMDRNQGPSATYEIDAYVGVAWTLSPDWNAKLSVAHYWYPDDPARSRYEYDEISASLTFRAQLTATVSWAPNIGYFGRYEGDRQMGRGSAIAYELTGLQPITSSLSLTAGVGYNDLTDIFQIGYWYWNTGVTYSVGAVQFDLSRIDNDSTAKRLFGSMRTKAGWTAAVSWSF